MINNISITEQREEDMLEQEIEKSRNNDDFSVLRIWLKESQSFLVEFSFWCSQRIDVIPNTLKGEVQHLYLKWWS